MVSALITSSICFKEFLSLNLGFHHRGLHQNLLLMVTVLSRNLSEKCVILTSRLHMKGSKKKRTDLTRDIINLNLQGLMYILSHTIIIIVNM